MGICKKMTKKLLGALLAFAMLVSIAPLPAQAIEGIDGKIVVVIGDKEYDMTDWMIRLRHRKRSINSSSSWTADIHLSD